MRARILALTLLATAARADTFGLTAMAGISNVAGPPTCVTAPPASISCSVDAFVPGEFAPLTEVRGTASAQASFGALKAHV